MKTSFGLLAIASLTAAVLTGAAAPTPFPPLAMADPLAPLPAAGAPGAGFSAFAPAPVPNHDVAGPVAAPTPQRVEVTPGIIHTQSKSYQGEGFTPKSTIQDEQQGKFKPAPGLNLSVPLQ